MSLTEEQIHAMNDRDRREVIALCERVGYGFTIDIAARGWDVKLGDPNHTWQWLGYFAKNLRAQRERETNLRKPRRKVKRSKRAARSRGNDA